MEKRSASIRASDEISGAFMANPGNVVVLAKPDGTNKFSQRDAINLANQRRLIILSNKLLDQRLVLSDTWKSEKPVYPAWSGTLVGYTKADERMGTFISFKDPDTGITYVFRVPKKAVGAKGIALAVNHLVDTRGRPLIEYEDKGEKQVLIRINDESKIKIVEAFPEKDEWYVAEKEFGIPAGALVGDSNSDARHLNRLNEYVGLLARGHNSCDLDGYYYSRDVGLRHPSLRLGVLAWENAVPAAEPAMR